MTVAAVCDPLDVTVPSGAWEGFTLAEVLDEGARGERWIRWALRQPVDRWGDRFEAALYLACHELDRRRRGGLST